MAERSPEASVSGSSTRRKARRTAVPERGAALTPEQRRRMITEGAYYRAERRGFHPGQADQDWLEAEAEIDQILIAGKDRA